MLLKPGEVISTPVCPSITTSSFATRTPRASPMADASSPTTPASASTDRITWRRVAPRARSSASSRLRWATRMVKVFQMMKEPTNTAIAAKTSRNVLMKLSCVSSRPARSSTTASADSACVPAGSVVASSSCSASGDVPSSAVTSTSS